MFFNRVFRQERFDRFLLFLAECSNFKKLLLIFFVGIKTFEISAYVEKHIFTKNVNNFETLRQIFL